MSERNPYLSRQIQLKAIHDRKPGGQVKRLSGQRCRQFKRAEAGRSCSGNTGVHELAAHAATGHGRIDKECPDAGRISGWIKKRVWPTLALVAAEKRTPLAPATAGDNAAVAFDDEVGLVINELGVDPEDVPSNCVCLGRRVIADAQSATRARDQFLKGGNVGMLSVAWFRHA